MPNSPVTPVRSRKHLILQIGAAALVLAAAVVVAVPVASTAAADTNVAAADAAVRKAEEAFGLLNAAEVKAAAEVVVAAEDRKTAERAAIFGKAMSSVMIGTFETRESVNRDYETEMDDAASAYDKVVAAHDAIVVKSEDAARELTVEESAQTEATAARDAASGAVETSIVAGGILAAVALALMGYSFFGRRQTAVGTPEATARN